MMFFVDVFADLEPPTQANAYDWLSSLCTRLLIAEEGAYAPLQKICEGILQCLGAPTSEPGTSTQKPKQKGKHSSGTSTTASSSPATTSARGDLLTMAARALAILLDKFSRAFQRLKKASFAVVVGCFELMFSVVGEGLSQLAFQQHTSAELTEDLLKCLTLGFASDALTDALPSTAVQISFCEAALNGSKWASCKVLHHCVYLIRSDLRHKTEERERMERLFLHHVRLLMDLDVDYEWDQLLQATTEGIVALRCHHDHATRRTASPQAEARKRCAHDERGNRATTHTEVMELYLQLAQRVCKSDTADSRKELVLACVDALLSSTSVVQLPAHVVQPTLDVLCATLKSCAPATVAFSNPFAGRGENGREEEAVGERVQRELPNLQWIVPELQWSLLLVMAKLCGLTPPVVRQYLWAWRSEDEIFYWYSPADRRRLTAAYFNGARELCCKKGRRSVSLIHLTDSNQRTQTLKRMHFQPIPYAYRLDGQAAHAWQPCAAGAALEEQLRRYPRVMELRRLMRSMSFGSTPTARMAKMLLLHVVCHSPPSREDDVQTAFRALVADEPVEVVESVAQRLVERDTAWAPILLEAGIADALSDSSTSAIAPTNTRSRAELSLRNSPRRSPVASLIRAASSSTSADAVVEPMAQLVLPTSPRATLKDFVAHATMAELVSALAMPTLCSDWGAQSPEQLASITANVTTAAKVRSSIAAFVLRELQTLHASENPRDLLHALAEGDDVLPLFICSSVGADVPDGEERGRASAATCPQGHTLTIHFSTTWSCNVCGNRTPAASHACRACDYDICQSCLEKTQHRVEVGATANAGDVLRYWRRRMQREKLTKSVAARSTLFTRDGAILSWSTPALSLATTSLHSAAMTEKCACGHSASPRATTKMSEDVVMMQQQHTYPLLNLLLRTMDGLLTPEEGVCQAINEVIESHGRALFLRGVAGLPPRLWALLHTLAPTLPASVKHEIIHFLVIGCRRFALQHLQDAGAVLRGTVRGEAETNGLPFKIGVPRTSFSAMITKIQDGFRTIPSTRSKVEFFFEGEEGTGSGPTQELYSELSQLAMAEQPLWNRLDDGMMLALPSLTAEVGETWFALGAACARAFIDGYGMSLDCSPVLWGVMRRMMHPASSTSGPMRERCGWVLLEAIEPAMVHSFSLMLRASPSELAAMMLTMGDATDDAITQHNVETYVQREVEQRTSVGLQNIAMFAAGMATSMEVSALWFCTDEELCSMMCGGTNNTQQKLFDAAELRACVMEAHGYSTGAKEVEMLVSIIGNDFDGTLQRYFLEFVTGSPRLPMNGLRGLGRKITVVRKEMDAPSASGKEQTLPSCNTCFLYVKLPPYTSRERMAERLTLAITEGRKNFSLS